MIEKAEMNIFRSYPSFLLVGAMASATGLATPARSDEIGQVVRIANRCDAYGPSFVDLGNGTCGIVSMGGQVAVGGRTRIDSGAQATGSGAWTNGTSNAALRNDGAGMLPGISDARHLRIQSGTDLYGR